MAKETTTTQCYPDDGIVNETIRKYEAFGWELIGNQRCQEETSYSYKTFNKLTFSREKSSAWYKEVTEMEIKYDKLIDEEPSKPSLSKASPAYFVIGALLLVFCALPLGCGIGLIGDMFGGGFAIPSVVIGVLMITVGIILISVGASKNGKYKKAYALYSARKTEYDATKAKEAKCLMEKSRAIVEM